MINTILPFYTANAYALRNKDYHSSTPTRLYCPSTKLLPFQVACSSGYTSITSLYLHNAATGAQVVELNAKINASDWVENAFTSPAKTYVMYLGGYAFAASYAIANGTYYLVLTTNEGVYYSETISVVDDLLTKSSRVKVEFYNNKDVDDDEPICYQDSWKQWVWLDGDIKGSGSKTVEEIDERDGYEILRSKSIYEIKRLRTTVSDSTYRALIRMQGHSNITITDREGRAWTAYNVKVGDPSWSGAGAYCTLIIEFMTETATFRNTNLNMA